MIRTLMTLVRLAFRNRQRCLVCNRRRDRHIDHICGPFFGLTECVQAQRQEAPQADDA